MYINNKFTLSILLLLSVITTSIAQDEIDTELWTGVTAKIKSGKRWSFGLNTQARFKKFVKKFDRVLVEFDANYNPRFHKFVKPFKLGTGLRYSFDYHENDGDSYLRFFVKLSYQWKRKKFFLEGRIQYQNRLYINTPKEKKHHPWAQDIRCRVKLGYDIKKLNLYPAIWGEAFFHEEVGAFDGFTKYRIGASLDYKINKQHLIGLKYIFEQEIRYFDPKTTHIIGFSYRYTYKIKKRKQK